jgi:hypothetical protein
LPGVLAAYEKGEQLPKSERYFWHFQFTGESHILVTMLPDLAWLVHSALELACDFTFKWVEGNINKWEVAIFPRDWEQHKFNQISISFILGFCLGITVARVYSDATDTDAFEAMITGFHEALYKATGTPMKLWMIHNAGPITYIFDAKAAQALGLAKAILRLPGVDRFNFHNEHDILAHVLITCHVHFHR